MMKKPSTSWEPVEGWYKQTVGKEGHYYHREVVLPGLLRLIKAHAPRGESLVDLACGQGVLARALPKEMAYIGVDLSTSLIAFAKKHDTNRHHRYLAADIADPGLAVDGAPFDCATVVLALQNVIDPSQVLANAARLLKKQGKLFIVLNHPCFRIPRQSFWGVDEQKKCRYRRLECYLSPMKIPIQAHPSMGKDSPQTWSFHHPLSSYIQWLSQAGFVVETMEEWCSPKQSTGRNAKMENRSRQEFPLFLTIVATSK
jgi:ubiquinone/menaquinone biosynthesis C-methylase UbiE